MNNNSDTIMAIATPINVVGAIGIIRMTGEFAHSYLENIFKPYQDFSNQSGLMQLGIINTKNFKDKAFAVKFFAPNSYTGENMAEIQFHGGKAIAHGIIRHLSEIGCRIATPGEFTKRAFLNGKMTLNEAEGIADIINAQSEAHVMQSFRMMTGEFSKVIHKFSKNLLDCLALVDVMLDYPEETSDEDTESIKEILRNIEDTLSKTYNSSLNNKYISDGVTAVIAGVPNTGKSSLLNAIIKDERAIVTEIPGTTRDILRESIEIDGIKINFIDTAGIRDSSDIIEKIGVDRAQTAIKSADIVLFITDLSKPQSKEEVELLKTFHNNHLLIGNKLDIKKYNRKTDINTSAKTGEGVDSLIKMIFNKLSLNGDYGCLTRDRHIQLLGQALKSIGHVLSAFNTITVDLISYELKQAYNNLTEITGENATESVIDKIFSTFCVGK
ncbi:MAG: tRNA uridine-5-carboxymethylaminomethyl(34) synthesis GTPase MnmE [Christensenellaceae bacterium]|jgi:tRNA modification GTPase|nr:tRNA uridine-5-carboxymethylaminomethyl(34) synthesis GTPase MnmE [Christensenellaceae bacterium]